MAERINEVTPDGLGRWDRLMEFVQEPDHRFFDAVDEWLDQDSEATRLRLQKRADSLVRAWREAGRQFEVEGLPQVSEEVPA